MKHKKGAHELEREAVFTEGGDGAEPKCGGAVRNKGALSVLGSGRSDVSFLEKRAAL